MTEPKFTLSLREAGAAHQSTKPSFPLAKMTGDLPGGKARLGGGEGRRMWGKGRLGLKSTPLGET